jgi:hypothetical protein
LGESRKVTRNPVLVQPFANFKLLSASCKRELIAAILLSYTQGEGETFEAAPLHDPCVIAYLLKPSLFSGRRVNGKRKRLYRINRAPDRTFRSGFSRLHFGTIYFPTRGA